MRIDAMTSGTSANRAAAAAKWTGALSRVSKGRKRREQSWVHHDLACAARPWGQVCILRAVATEAGWAGGYVSPPRMRLMPKPCGACEARDSSYVRGRRQVGERKRLRPSQTGSPHRPSIAGTRVIPPGRWAVGRVRPGRRAPLWRPNTVDGTVGEFERFVTRHSAPISEAVVAIVASEPPRPAQTPVGASSASWVRIGRALTGQPLAWVRSDRLMASCTHFDRCTRARGSKHG